MSEGNHMLQSQVKLTSCRKRLHNYVQIDSCLSHPTKGEPNLIEEYTRNYAHIYSKFK